MRSVVVIVMLLAACTSKQKAPQPTQETKPAEPVVVAEPAVMVKPASVEDAERTAYANAKPVFDKYCTKCHVQGAEKATAKKLEHFDMTSYPFGGHHADVIGPTIANVLGLTGKKKATMPSDNKGAVQGEELALVKAWIDAWNAAHDHHDH